MEKYGQARGTDSSGQNPESLLRSTETRSHLCHRAANIPAIYNKIQDQHGLDLLSTFCSTGLHGAYAVRLLSSVIEAE